MPCSPHQAPCRTGRASVPGLVRLLVDGVAAARGAEDKGTTDTAATLITMELLAWWPWLGRILMCGPVGPVPSFNHVRFCSLGVDHSTCKCTLQTPWVFGNIGIAARVVCAIARTPPPSPASSAGAPGQPQIGHTKRICWELCRIGLVGWQPARCTLLVNSFACPRAELTPEIDALLLDNGAWSATSRCTRPRLCQDQAAGPEEPSLRALDQHGLVPRQFGSLCTSWGVRGVAHAWPQGTSCPQMCAPASGPLAGLHGRFPRLGMTCGSPVSAGAQVCSCRAGPRGSTALFNSNTLGGSSSKSAPLSCSLVTRACTWLTGELCRLAFFNMACVTTLPHCAVQSPFKDPSA
jgi:hypothetical protein